MIKKDTGVMRLKKRLNLCLSFDENYDLSGPPLGSGSYGEVRVCRSIKEKSGDAGAEFAVKIVRKTSPYFSRTRVLREIETFYTCREHENIIQFLHFFEEPTGFYLIFELIVGGPLLAHIRNRNSFNEHEASSIVSDLAKALRFLHYKGIAHRDLKPENVLCVSRDSPCPVKLGDFDLCSQMTTNTTTPKLYTPVGSLEYMAPEVLETFTARNNDYMEDDDGPSYNKKCDLWSLGVLLYILLSGVPPFVGKCTRETCGWEDGEACSDCQRDLSSSIRSGHVYFSEEAWKEVSEDARDLVSRLLVKDSEERLSAEGLLRHPWISNSNERHNSLSTPFSLRRIHSLSDISNFTSSAYTLLKSASSQAK